MINGTNILQYVKCPRIIWNNLYAPSEEKKDVHEFMRKKMDEGLVIEKDYIKKVSHDKFRYKDLNDGFKKTLALMKKGVKRIYHPVILFDDFIGIPDLIEKVKGKSRLGNYYYVAGDIKSSIRPKEEQKMQVVFYNYLLSKIQRYLPNNAFIILRNESRYDFDVSERITDMKKYVNMIKEIQDGLEVSPTINSKCSLCPWKDYCFSIALKNDDISMIKGLGSTAKSALNGLGIYKIKDVMKLNPNNVDIKGASTATIEKWKRQAESLEKRKVIKIGKAKFPHRLYEIYLDLESQDDTQTVYLIGLVVNGKVKQFTALKPMDEKKNFMEFLRYVVSLKDFVIYHYGGFEKTKFNVLFERFKIDKDIRDKVMSSMIDLLPIINSTVVLPLHSYSLKRLARYLGFKWTDKKADAAESMYWYDLWLKSKELKWLDLSRKYNEDDCKATKVIKEWLEKV